MNKLTAEKCREQFEARIRNLDGDYNLIGVGEVYIDVETQIEWRTWQEAWNKALEIALPILEQQERGEWIEWSGGECPVHPRKIVDLKLRKGSITTGYPAGSAQWDHLSEDDDTDIIAYRIIPQRPTNQNGAES